MLAAVLQALRLDPPTPRWAPSSAALCTRPAGSGTPADTSKTPPAAPDPRPGLKTARQPFAGPLRAEGLCLPAGACTVSCLWGCPRWKCKDLGL